jgi:hypothetical protein
MIYFDVKLGRIGDALAALPYMRHVQTSLNKPAIIGPDFNAWVWDGLNLGPDFSRAPSAPPCAKIIEVDPQRAWHCCFAHGWRSHMAEGHFEQAHLTPHQPFIIPFKPASRIEPDVNYVIAPFSITDHNFNKKWPMEYWVRLLATLEGHIYVLGDATDDIAPFTAIGCIPILGQPLIDVATLLRWCKCLITIDTGIGHLGVMLNLANHVMIYPGTVPPCFAETPFGINVRGPTTHNILPVDVLKAVQDCERKSP